MAYTKEKFQKQVIPSLYIPKNCGNMYCGSVYSALISLVSQIPSEELVSIFILRKEFKSTDLKKKKYNFFK